MKALRTEHKAVSFLVEPASRDAVLEVLHIMPHWQVDEELSPEGLALRFSYGRKAV